MKIEWVLPLQCPSVLLVLSGITTFVALIYLGKREVST